MKIALVSFALATVVQAAPVPKELRTDPLEQFQGKWRFVGIDVGEGLHLTGIEGMILHFEGDAVSIALPDGVATKYSATFDTRAAPIRMMLTTKTSVIPGILKIESDRLYWCQALGDKPHPEKIRAGDGYRYFLLKRVDK